MRSVEERYRGREVRVFALDSGAAVRRLEECAHRLLAERPEVMEVRLFGSLARGEAGPASDADLFIVVADDADPGFDPWRWFRGAGIGCDFFVRTAAEAAELERSGSRFADAVYGEGLVLARRRP